MNGGQVSCAAEVWPFTITNRIPSLSAVAGLTGFQRFARAPAGANQGRSTSVLAESRKIRTFSSVNS